MSKKATDAAWRLYPDYPSMDGGYVTQRKQRELVMKGYEQAERDLALSLEQVVKLDNIIMNMVGEGYNDGYKTRPFYEEVLKRFNEQRKK